MKPQEDIKKYFKNATLNTNQEKHEAIFEKILNAQQKTNEQEPESSRKSLGRIIMRSQVSKIAIAAVVFFACIIGLTMFKGTSSIALGNVLAQIEKTSAYTYEMNMTTKTIQVVNNKTIDTDREIHGTVLCAQELGMKMTMKVYEKNREENSSQEIFVLFDEKALLTIMYAEKKYMRVEVDDEYIEQAKKQNYDPHAMVKLILDCEYEVLEQKTIDGIKVQGFHTNDPKFEGLVLGKADIKLADVTLWVDVQTQLPFQMVMEFQFKQESTQTSISAIINNFQWNTSINDKEFQPVIPDDYTSALDSSVKIPAIYEEETALDGLKIYAELSGNYPKDLSPVFISSEISKIIRSDTIEAKEFQEEIKELSVKEKTQKMVDISLKVQDAGMFYTMLIQDQKDPAYYGDRVLPGDADNVLMRWKLSGNDYRVIFGDLKVETLTYDTLIQIEKTLPEKEEIEN